MDRALKCDHSWESSTLHSVVLFVFQFYPVCNFGRFISFGLGTVISERVELRGDVIYPTWNTIYRFSRPYNLPL